MMHPTSTQSKHYYVMDTYLGAYLVQNGHDIEQIAVSPDTGMSTLWFAATPDLYRLVQLYRSGKATTNLPEFRHIHRMVFRQVSDARYAAREAQMAEGGAA